MADRTVDVAVQVRQLFDDKAATWPSKYSPNGRLAPRLTRLASAVTQRVPAGGSVLDLGCGTGELARTMADAELLVTGSDISAEMLQHAADAVASRVVDWVQLDPGWRALPFAPATFDAVVAASVLEYVEDPTGVLRECCRVLRPGGTVLCTVPDPRHPIRWLERLLAVVARIPPVSHAECVSGRLGGYVTYLHVSRQRHSRQWWHAAATRAGLRADPDAADRAGCSPLRLLSFQRPEAPGCGL
jgi:ubiquinone/menaquinone biosynthesis C-methylase UbiE